MISNRIEVVHAFEPIVHKLHFDFNWESLKPICKHLIDTTEKEVSAWLNLLKKIKPTQVMIYTIARDTPLNSLEKVSVNELNSIAEKIKKAGFDVQVSG